MLTFGASLPLVQILDYKPETTELELASCIVALIYL